MSDVSETNDVVGATYQSESRMNRMGAPNGGIITQF